MIDKVRKNIKKHKMIQKGEKVLLGLSGGPDSVCLLYILLALKKEFGFHLHIAHLNHGIRREAGGDVNYVRWLSRKFKIPITVAKKNIPKIVKEEDGSIEMVSRKIRYRFLFETAENAGAVKIAIGHNRDDQVETFLLNFLRGTGPAGLSAMPYKRKLGRLKNGKSAYLIRPLIEVSRREIISYLSKRNVRPRIDASNLKLIYKRNRIRRELLPLLEKRYNPGIKEVIGRMIRIFEEENVFWRRYLKSIFKNTVIKQSKKEICLSVRKLSVLSPAVQNRIIQTALKELFGGPKGLTFMHITAIRKLYQKERGRKFLTLPDKIQVIKDYDNLIFGREKAETKSKNREGFIKPADKLTIHFSPCYKNGAKEQIKKIKRMPPEERFEAILDKDKLHFPLILRRKRPGDKFWPLGLKSFSKLKRYFINKKVGLLERENILLLADGQDRIVWVVGKEIADWGKVTGKTKVIVKVSIKNAKTNTKTNIT